MYNAWVLTENIYQLIDKVFKVTVNNARYVRNNIYTIHSPAFVCCHLFDNLTVNFVSQKFLYTRITRITTKHMQFE